MQLLGAAGDGPALAASFLNLFKEEAQPSACDLVGAVCRVSRVDSEPVAALSSSDSTMLRITVEDLRGEERPSGPAGWQDQQHLIGDKSSHQLQQELPPADHPAAAAAAGHQGGQQRLLGPAFIVGALQAFADSGLLRIRSVRVLAVGENVAVVLAGGTTAPRGHQSDGGDTIVEVEVDDPSMIGSPPALGLLQSGLPWPDLRADYCLLSEQYKV